MNDRQRAASSNSGSEPDATRHLAIGNKMRGFRCPHSSPRPLGARHTRDRLKASRSRQRDDNPNRPTCGMSRKNQLAGGLSCQLPKEAHGAIAGKVLI